MAKVEKTYEVSEEMQMLAKRVIKEKKVFLPADISEISIEYIKEYPEISKTCVAKCVKSSKLLKFYSEADIIIMASGDIWDAFNEETKFLVMFHELLHIGINYKKNGDMTIGLIDHNVKDFYEIISEYGIDWLNGIKATVASINDYQNGEEDKIRI